MSLQRVRSEIEAIETSYTDLRMQLRLVLSYLQDDVPDAELARRILGEAKKMVSVLDNVIDGLGEAFWKIDRMLGTDIALKAGRLHEYISSISADPEDGVIKALEMIDERILGNDIEKAVEHLEALQASVERKGAIACLAQGINWDALKEEDLVKTVSVSVKSKGEGKRGPKKGGKGEKRGPKRICLIYSASPENDYLIQGLVGKFLEKNGIEPVYMAGGRDETIGEYDAIVAFMTKDMVGPEKILTQFQKGYSGKLAVYVESGADVPREVKDRHELLYFSRDRTGELLLQMFELL